MMFAQMLNVIVRSNLLQHRNNTNLKEPDFETKYRNFLKQPKQLRLNLESQLSN